MDQNKLKVLREVSYSIKPACGLCSFGQFRELEGGDFGTCYKFSYQHQKHTGEKRQLSIFRYGSCPSFELDKGNIILGPDMDIGPETAWKEFLKP